MSSDIIENFADFCKTSYILICLKGGVQLGFFFCTPIGAHFFKDPNQPFEHKHFQGSTICDEPPKNFRKTLGDQLLETGGKALTGTCDTNLLHWDRI